MRLDLQIQNLESVSKALAKLSGPQAKAAYSKAINDTGFMVRKAMQTEFGKFDRVTPFIQKSPKLIAATPDRLSASILPTLDSRNLPSTGGKIGVDPQDVLCRPRSLAARAGAMLAAIARFKSSPPRSVIVGLLSAQASAPGSAPQKSNTASTPESSAQLF